MKIMRTRLMVAAVVVLGLAGSAPAFAYLSTDQKDHVASPPPAPTLAVDATSASLILTAAANARPYSITLFLDGASAPFRAIGVTAGDRLTAVMAPPEASPGIHELAAAASLDGVRSWSRPIEVRVPARTTAGTTGRPEVHLVTRLP